ncbi:MAG: diaminopimelate decarboxylase [Acidobacteria bacterium]|nr:diaminopimelate decarboxylase [Acidobacteriota bacterium]MCW5969706.1 diaminopimelate decarboxylase [Blastocatellales bacterium]
MKEISDPKQPAWTIPGYLEIRNNHLHISGADAEALADRFDTPLFVFSAPRIRANIARLLQAAAHHARLKLCYASKANNLLGVLRVVRDSGIDVEVNSGGELFRAIRAGFAPEQIEMNGIAKSEQEIAEAISAGIYAINLDSPFELELVERVAERLNRRANVTVRLIAGVGTRSHIGLQTALNTSKFGISPLEARRVMLRAVKNSHLVNLAGVHIHVGSQTPDVDPYLQAFTAMWEHLLWLHSETGHRLSHINIGGGIPVNYLRDRAQAAEIGEGPRTMLAAQLTAAEMIDATAGAVRASAREAGAEGLLDELEIVMEPGRSVIADAGTLLTRVRNEKFRPETGENWLLTDAGYNLMLSMVMYQWYYHAVNASRAAVPHVARYKMAGPLCDGGDVYFDLHGEGRLPDHRLLPGDVKVGEVIAMLNTGAYTAAQMTAYNGRPMPAAVMIDDDGSVEVIRRRDSYEDLLLNET